MEAYHMWPFGFGFFGFSMVFWWVLWIIVAYLVYQDAEKRGMNGLLWFILVLIPMAGIIFLLVYLAIRDQHRAEEKGERSKALEILKERYAKGEITKEEFERMKSELEE
ncbi:Short C-terminal domain [Geoglobus ahangari]|uniref:Short C-terminal domain n=1 Tax=Geoglobus ahangari TaxID=113653 RepID=A0A0F7IF45_9EURY|nr:SHOCT domain-containing protein [Geoglobus ahangari]AKG91055.1 Short C-terminal domain [Geoglobus ahangari]